MNITKQQGVDEDYIVLQSEIQFLDTEKGYIIC